MHTGRYLSQPFEIFTPKMREAIVNSRALEEYRDFPRFFTASDTDSHFIRNFYHPDHITDVIFLGQHVSSPEKLALAFGNIYRRFSDGKMIEIYFNKGEIRNVVGEFFTPGFNFIIREQLAKVWSEVLPDSMEEIFFKNRELLAKTLLKISREYLSGNFHDLAFDYREGQTWLEIIEEIDKKIVEFPNCKGIGFDYQLGNKIINLILHCDPALRIIKLNDIDVRYESTVSGSLFKFIHDKYNSL